MAAVEDIEVWREAQRLVRVRGARALAQVENRLERHREDHDLIAVALWLQIRRAVRQLLD